MDLPRLRRHLGALVIRPFPDEAFNDYVDRVTAEETQRELDDRAESAAKRNAAGTSPEVLSMQDAFCEGQRAGQVGISASLNPYQLGVPEYAEWERARSAVIGARLNSQRKIA